MEQHPKPCEHQKLSQYTMKNLVQKAIENMIRNIYPIFLLTASQ